MSFLDKRSIHDKQPEQWICAQNFTGEGFPAVFCLGFLKGLDGTGEIRLLILWSFERFHKLTKNCMTSAICRENREQQIDFTLKYSIDKIYMQPVKHSVLNGLEWTVRIEKHTVGIEIYP